MSIGLYEFIEADPHVTEIREHHKEQHQSIHTKHRELRLLAREIPKLFLAYDACVNQMNRIEVADKGSDQILEELTLDDLEVWANQYNSAAELVFQQIISTCQKVISKNYQLDRAQAEVKDTCKALSDARAKAKERFHEQEKEDAE